MLAVLASILPLIVGSALVPVQIIMVVLLLTSEKHPVVKATAFVGGMTLMRLLQGLVFGLIFVRGEESTAAEDSSAWVVSTLLIVLGILLLRTAYKYWNGEDDPDAPPPKWRTMLTDVSTVGAFGMGAGLIAIAAKLWVFTLGALGVIAEAQLGWLTAGVTFFIYIFLAQILLLTPILIRLLVPDRSIAMLNATSVWLDKYNRQIVTVVSLIFGIFFLARGIGGFI